MIKNFGISFGIKIGGLGILSGLMLVVMGWWYVKSRNWRILPILIGGGLNFIERWQHGYVVDYWRIPFTSIYNNLNDWLIFVGVVLLLWQMKFLTK